MGLLAYFFVAMPEDALHDGPLVKNGASYKNFTPLAIEVLWTILRNEPSSEGCCRLEHISHTQDSWLSRFPDELVLLISMLNEAAIPRVADVWARNEEVPGQADEHRPILRELRLLAIQAQRDGKSVYLWVSL